MSRRAPTGVPPDRASIADPGGADVVVQGACPAYRRGFFELLKATHPVPLQLVSGDDHFDPSVSTIGDPNPVDRRVRNLWGPGRRVLAQPGAVRPAVAARTAVLEFNPRNITTWAIAITRRMLRRPTVLWGHVAGMGGSGALARVLRTALSRSGDVLVVYTSAERDAAVRQLPKTSVVVAPNAISSTNEPRLTTGPEPTSFVYSGRLVETKGVPELVAGFAAARQRGWIPDDCRLKLVGGGPLEVELREQSARLGVGDVVRFLGAVDATDPEQIAAIYDDAVASTCAGYVGLNALQSLWWGRPMLAVADAPHAPEFHLLIDGWNSLIVETSATEDLAHGFGLLWERRHEWVQRRDEIAQPVRGLHNIESMVDGMQRAIASVQRDS